MTLTRDAATIQKQIKILKESVYDFILKDRIPPKFFNTNPNQKTSSF